MNFKLISLPSVLTDGEKRQIISRRKMKIVMLVTITAILCFWGCKETIGNSNLEITKLDYGKEIALKEQASLTVKLEGNPTTGYTWNIGEIPGCLEQIGEANYVPDSDKIGSPGNIILSFKAAKKGEGVLKLFYKRSWEKDVAPLDSFGVKIIVK
jgi:inhibitor of cysteine peptidase